MNTLTKQQKQILDFITNYGNKNGISPSLEEICKQFKLASVSTAHYYISALEKKGYIEKKKKDSGVPRGFKVKNNNFSAIPTLAHQNIDSVSVPIVGAANCGPANIFADEHIEGYLKLPRNILPKVPGFFVIRAEGDSMNRADIKGKHIDDGDLVLIDGNDRTPLNGDYVLSIINGFANIKRFKIEEKTGQPVLISESKNPKHKPIFLHPDDEFMINGKVVSIVKS